jgi:hypothetical protein
MKYWTEENQIIILTDDNLLFGNYSTEDIRDFEGQLNKGVIPNQITGIPLQYIKDIQTNERTKKIEFELGKGSTEKLEFSSKKLRDTIFDYIKNKLALTVTTPSSTKIWRRFWKTTLLIIFLTTAIMTLGQTSGYNPGTKAIAAIINWLTETFDNSTILTIGALLIIWRTSVLILDLKELKGITRLSR